MADVLVDSNVLLDVLTEDARWYAWSAGRLAELGDTAELVINPLIYSEVSVGFDTIEALDEALSPRWFRREPLPWAAGFLAGKCFQQYRQAGGTRRSPLPDFHIGAHAAIMEMRLLTRDARRYRSYLPQLEIISPDEAG
ncbi:MAG: type II toxin-antitoxin system VapC family toxin [Halofilum sp. (in: g-proteobacteria)]|nr:type II toxin-antitoxin system VapC family toxin [Halofilum sp. (in: g-proteobacteria)]